MFFLAVYRIECDDRTVLDTEFRQQRLCCRDLVGFLGDIDVGEYQGRVRGEGAQYLGGGAVVEVVEAAAQRLAIERDARSMSGVWKRGHGRAIIVRHRQTKGAATDMLDLQQPHHIPTPPACPGFAHTA